MKVNAEKTLFGPWFGIRSWRSERLNSGWICEDLPAVVLEGPALPTLEEETPTLVPVLANDHVAANYVPNKVCNPALSPCRPKLADIPTCATLRFGLQTS